VSFDVAGSNARERAGVAPRCGCRDVVAVLMRRWCLDPASKLEETREIMDSVDKQEELLGRGE
jgi:hypothetical protein